MRNHLRCIVLINLCAFGMSAKAQIQKAEYFFNSDPGFGNATKITIPTNKDTFTISFSANIQPLSDGLNYLYLRAKSSAGWSITNSWPVIKQTLPAQENIANAEYFFNSDPGFGKAIKLNAIPSNKDSFTITFSPSIDPLKEGVNILYLRTADAKKNWSVTNAWLFVKNAPSLLPNVIKAEYFFDTDPGFGKGTRYNLASGVNITDSIKANISSLDSGKHIFYLRTLDASGNWSITNLYRFSYKKTALPLNWLSFTATTVKNNALLKWQTANEVNVSHFEIYYSNNGFDWYKAGEISANNKPSNEYSYFYQGLDEGVNYFRIKEVDKDGHYNFSMIKTISSGNATNSLFVSPTPVRKNQVFTITSDLFKKGNCLVTIIGGNGVRYQQQKVSETSNSINISLNSFITAGLYYVEVVNENIKQTRKFIVIN